MRAHGIHWAANADGDERQGQAPALERHPRHERQRRDPEPPDDEAAGVVERRRGAGRQALLVEPDRLQVHRPCPPRRGRRVGRGQAVVVAVHLAGQVEQGLAGVARRPARDELVVLDQRPRDVGQDVDPEREDDHAQRAPRRPARPAASPAGASRRAACPAGRAGGSGRPGRAARRAARTRSVRPTRTGRPRPATPTPRAMATSSGVTASDPIAIVRVEPAGRQGAEEDQGAERRRARRPRSASPRRSRRSGGPRRRPRPGGSGRP